MRDRLPFLIGCDLDFAVLSMYSGCGAQSVVVHGACPGLVLILLAGPRELAAGSVWVLELPAMQLLQL